MHNLHNRRVPFWSTLWGYFIISRARCNYLQACIAFYCKAPNINVRRLISMMMVLFIQRWWPYWMCKLACNFPIIQNGSLETSLRLIQATSSLSFCETHSSVQACSGVELPRDSRNAVIAKERVLWPPTWLNTFKQDNDTYSLESVCSRCWSSRWVNHSLTPTAILA